jgi:hypothetical protein
MHPTANVSFINKMLLITWEKMPETMRENYIKAFDLKKAEWRSILVKWDSVVNWADDFMEKCRMNALKRLQSLGTAKNRQEEDSQIRSIITKLDHDSLVSASCLNNPFMLRTVWEGLLETKRHHEQEVASICQQHQREMIQRDHIITELKTQLGNANKQQN